MKELGESVPDGGANGAGGKGSKAGVGVSGAVPPPLIPGQPPPWMQGPQFPPHMPPHGHPPPPHMMMHPHPGGGQSVSLMLGCVLKLHVLLKSIANCIGLSIAMKVFPLEILVA
jgi:hypothetical protein